MFLKPKVFTYHLGILERCLLSTFSLGNICIFACFTSQKCLTLSKGICSIFCDPSQYKNIYNHRRLCEDRTAGQILIWFNYKAKNKII